MGPDEMSIFQPGVWGSVHCFAEFDDENITIQIRSAKGTRTWEVPTTELRQRLEDGVLGKEQEAK